MASRGSTAGDEPHAGRSGRYLEIVGLAAALCLAACGPSVEDRIDELGAGPDERAAARHELTLAADEAIEPLIAALESPDGDSPRDEVAAILAGIRARSGNERVADVLNKHLLDDPDPVVRGRIAEELGMRMRSEYFGLFLQALSDPSPLVQTPALFALGNVLDRLNDEQIATLRRLAGERAESQDRSVRDAALSLVEEFIRRWAKEAQKAALKANISLADSIYNRALAYAPASRQANYHMGTFYLEHGDRDRGKQLLREHRLLIDVPRFAAAPQIDGRLDDPVWRSAGRIDSFYTFSGSLATMLPRVETHVLMGYTEGAFYWGAHCFDAHPESLLVLPMEDKLTDARGDRISFTFDRDLDKMLLAGLSVNPEGAVRDRWSNFSEGHSHDYSWDVDGAAATFVGDDFWSVEFELRWDDKYHPRPAPGELSALNFTRLFRNVEYSMAFLRYDRHYATGYIAYQ